MQQPKKKKNCIKIEEKICNKNKKSSQILVLFWRRMKKGDESGVSFSFFFSHFVLDIKTNIIFSFMCLLFISHDRIIYVFSNMKFMILLFVFFSFFSFFHIQEAFFPIFTAFYSLVFFLLMLKQHKRKKKKMETCYFFWEGGPPL